MSKRNTDDSNSEPEEDTELNLSPAKTRRGRKAQRQLAKAESIDE